MVVATVVVVSSETDVVVVASGNREIKFSNSCKQIGHDLPRMDT